MAEYERQLAEGADSASVTKEENDRFKDSVSHRLDLQPLGHRLSPLGGEKPVAERFPEKCRIL